MRTIIPNKPSNLQPPSSFSLRERARMAHVAQVAEDRQAGAQLLVNALGAILKVEIPQSSVRWPEPGTRPVATVEGYRFTARWNDGWDRVDLFLLVTCPRCHKDQEFEVRGLAELGALQDADALCPTCAERDREAF